MSQIIKSIAQHVLVRQWRAAGLGGRFTIMILILLVSGVHSFMTRSNAPARTATTVGEVVLIEPIQSQRQPKAIVSFKYYTRSGSRYIGFSRQTLRSITGVAVGDKITVKYRIRKPKRSSIVSLKAPTPAQAPLAGNQHKPASKYWSQLNKPKVRPEQSVSWLGFLLYGGIIAFALYRLFVAPLLRLANFLARMWRKEDEAAEPLTGIPAGQQQAVLREGTDAIPPYDRRTATLTGPDRSKPMSPSTADGMHGSGDWERASPQANSPGSSSRIDNGYRPGKSRYKTRFGKAPIGRRKSNVKTRAGWFD